MQHARRILVRGVLGRTECPGAPRAGKVAANGASCRDTGAKSGRIVAMSAAMSARPARIGPAPALLLALLLGASGASGCARPFRGPKTLAAIGVGVLAASAALWVAGERSSDHPGLARVGAAGAAAGALSEMAAGTWLAETVGCRVDPDCPEAESCREIPAAPGREPFRQCLPK
jgi:hypothetical protein